MKIIIIGGVAAGMSAAAKARRVNKAAEIIVYTDEQQISYAACGLPYAISGTGNSFDNLLIRSVEDFRVNNVTVKTGFYVEEINKEKNTLLIKDIQNNTVVTDSYDRLIIATGARAFLPDLPGNTLANIYTLRTYSDGRKLLGALKSLQKPKITIIGGGYIGLEMAENFSSFAEKITIIEMAPYLASTMDAEIGVKIGKYLEEKGIEILLSEKVVAFEGINTVSSVITERRSITTDLVLIGAGVVPNSEIAIKAGLATGKKNAILVDNYCRTSFNNIFAAGDCATIKNLLTNTDEYIPLGTNANKQGRAAGENAAGGHAEVTGVLGTAIAKVFDMEIAQTGLSVKELKDKQIPFLTSTISAKTKPQYYPGAQEITVKLNFDKNAKVWGGQIIGGRGTAKRIDVLASAITGGLSLEDISMLDLSYAPPFSTVWDPIAIAAEQALKNI